MRYDSVALQKFLHCKEQHFYSDVLKRKDKNNPIDLTVRYTHLKQIIWQTQTVAHISIYRYFAICMQHCGRDVW